RNRGAPAVWALIVLNVAMFGVEYLRGGSTNPTTLYELGELNVDSVVKGHEYWRLFTALFLHAGWLHIAVNLCGLYLLGPELEEFIGSVRFTIGYLVSGLGSSIGVFWLWTVGLTKASELVGASGCIMGVIGITAGLLLRHRQLP